MSAQHQPLFNRKTIAARVKLAGPPDPAHALTAEIVRIEAEINTRAYALFDLTPAEIELLEANI